MNKKHLQKFLMATVLVGIVPVCHADLLIKDFVAAKTNQNKEIIVNIQLRSIYEGISYTNLEFESKGAKRIFCPPGALPIEANNLAKILDKQIAFFEQVMRNRGGFDYNMPVGPILISGLKKTFPCN